MKHQIEAILNMDDKKKESEVIKSICKALKELKCSDEDSYYNLKEELYVIENGYVLSKSKCKEWVSHMENSDGTTGEHWSVEDTTKFGKQVGIDYKNDCTEYEWWATMNMMYSDYFGCFPNDLTIYTKLSYAFIKDKDACEGKVYRYYKYITK